MTDRESHSLRDLDRSSGQASGRPHGAKQGAEVGGMEDRLQAADPALRGLRVDDELRDRRGKGVSGDYDDSVDHEADGRYRGPDAADRPVDPDR